MCVAVCLVATGCQDQWEWKWPDQHAANSKTKSKIKIPTSQPADPGPTPQQEIAQLRRQIKTLRERLEVIENENAKLRKSNENVKELQKTLEQQTFTAKMQAEDLKALRTAARERDSYKKRCDKLQKEVMDLTARIVSLLKTLAATATDANPDKTPTTKPTGP